MVESFIKMYVLVNVYAQTHVCLIPQVVETFQHSSLSLRYLLVHNSLSEPYISIMDTSQALQSQEVYK